MPILFPNIIGDNAVIYIHDINRDTKAKMFFINTDVKNIFIQVDFVLSYPINHEYADPINFQGRINKIGFGFQWISDPA